jgi:hypothetical protein
MTDKLSSSDLRRYAMLGAEARLAELNKETASIYQAFPELRKQRGARSVPAAAGVVAPRTGRRRRRRTMSAAQREEVRQRMKRYWAQRRGASAGTQGEAAGAKAGRAAGKRGRRKMSARWAKRKKANA